MSKAQEIKNFIKKLPFHKEYTFKYVRENLPHIATDTIRVTLHRLHDNGLITIENKGIFSKEDKNFEVYLFVYGSLKKGFQNEHILDKAKYISKAITVRKFSMYEARGGEYPYLLKDKPSNPIKGELYKIPRKDLLKKIDLFEGSPDYYTRESIVIYPPVDTNSFVLKEEKKDFYLTASRLVPYKKTKLIVEAFNLMPNKKLIVIGEGEEYNAIKKIAKSNISVLGYQDTKELIKYMQNAKAFVYAAIEDFGIVPIEAMSCGTPVIGLNKGGTAETIKNELNGIHFEKQTREDIIKAINKFESIKFDYKNIAKLTERYSEKIFKNEFKKFVDSKLIKKSSIIIHDK